MDQVTVRTPSGGKLVHLVPADADRTVCNLYDRASGQPGNHSKFKCGRCRRIAYQKGEQWPTASASVSTSTA
jgi:hypothetical protein